MQPSQKRVVAQGRAMPNRIPKGRPLQGRSPAGCRGNARCGRRNRPRRSRHGRARRRSDGRALRRSHACDQHARAAHPPARGPALPERALRRGLPRTSRPAPPGTGRAFPPARTGTRAFPRPLPPRALPPCAAPRAHRRPTRRPPRCRGAARLRQLQTPTRPRRSPPPWRPHSSPSSACSRRRMFHVKHSFVHPRSTARRPRPSG